jgi:hypothetical protein
MSLESTAKQVLSGELLNEAKSKWPSRDKVIIPVKGSVTIEFHKGNPTIAALIDDFNIKPADMEAALLEAVYKYASENGVTDFKIHSTDPPYSEWLAKRAKNVLGRKNINVVSTMT